MKRNEIIEECLRILSKDGKIKFEDLDPIGKATWLAFEKGFIKCFEFINRPIVENAIVDQSSNPLLGDAYYIAVKNGHINNSKIKKRKNGELSQEALEFLQCMDRLRTK